MDERNFYRESQERKPHRMICGHCGHRFELSVLWYRRIKKPHPPPGASREDLVRFQNARSYLMRADDIARCPNPECGKRVEIVDLQSVVYLQEEPVSRGAPSGRGGRRGEPSPRGPVLTSHLRAGEAGLSSPEQPQLTMHQHRGGGGGRRRGRRGDRGSRPRRR